MRPKRYPFSGKIKVSTAKEVKTMDQVVAKALSTAEIATIRGITLSD